MMKKILFVAVLVMLSTAVAMSAQDGRHGKKKGKHAREERVVVADTITLETHIDSLSYATGMAVSRGLIEYLQRTCEFDTLFFADFIRGFHDAIARGSDPKYVAYNAGVQIGTQSNKQILPNEAQFYDDTPDSLVAETFYKGLLDGARSDTTFFTVEAATQYKDEVKKAITTKKNEEYDAQNKAWLEENKTKEGVITLPSGLQYKILVAGNGVVAADTSNVTVRYEGKMIDGTVFDSSYERTPDTSTFKPTRVVKGWGEALTMMPEGSKWEVYIPQELGYGKRASGKIKPYSTLIFTIEVVKVE